MIRVSVGDAYVEAETVADVFQVMRGMVQFQPFLIQRERSWSPYPQERADREERKAGTRHGCLSEGRMRDRGKGAAGCRACTCGAQLCDVLGVCQCTDQVAEDRL